MEASESTSREETTVPVLLWGSRGVGKTDVASAWLGSATEESSEPKEPEPTVELVTGTTALTIEGGRTVTVVVHDTPGDPDAFAKVVSNSLMRKMKAAVLVYDCGDEASYAPIRDKLQEFATGKVDVKLAVIANKDDIAQEDQVVAFDEAKSMVESFGGTLFALSTKRGDDCSVVLQDVVARYLKGPPLNVSKMSDMERLQVLHRAAKEGGLEHLRALLKHVAVDVPSLDPKRESALIAATRFNQEVAARLLVENGAHVTARDADRITALHFAAWQGNCSLAEFLIAKGAQLDATRDDGWTPLHFACKARHAAMVRLLLSHRAAVDPPSRIGSTPLIVAVQENAPDVVVSLLEKHADVNARGDRKQSALFFAAGNDDPRITKLLLEASADPDCRDVYGQTPLHVTAAHNSAALAEVLLDDGKGDPTVLDLEGRSPLHIAAGKGNVEVFRAFLVHLLKARGSKRENVVHDESLDETSRILSEWQFPRDIVDSLSHGLMCAAARSGKLSVMETTLSLFELRSSPPSAAAGTPGGSGASPLPSIADKPPLHIAAEGAHSDIVKILLEAGASVKQRDLRGNNALHVAAAAGDVESVRLLLDAGAEVDARNDKEESPLLVTVHSAFSRPPSGYSGGGQHMECARLLLEKGADPNAQDADQNSAVLAAASLPTDPARDPMAIEKTTEMLTLLLEAGCNPNLRGFGGVTPLFVSMLMRNPTAIAALLKHGAKRSVPVDVDGRGCPLCPLAFAITTHNADCLRALLVGGIDPNGPIAASTLHTLQTPLHFAAVSRDAEVVRLLLEAEADPKIPSPDQENRTPLHSAATAEIARLLVSAGAPLDARDANGKLPLDVAVGEGIASIIRSASLDKSSGDVARDFSRAPGTSDSAASPPGTIVPQGPIVRVLLGAPHVVGDPGDEHTAYPITVTLKDPPRTVNIERRFRQFKKLYETIAPHASKPLPKHPPKKFFGRFRSDRVEQRRAGFQAILEACLTDPKLAGRPEVRNFLSQPHVEEASTPVTGPAPEKSVDEVKRGTDETKSDSGSEEEVQTVEK